MNEIDKAAADDWMRDHLPDPNECSLEDSEEQADTQSYFFLRLRDSATVVYKVAVKDGKVTSVLQEVYHGESSQEEPDERKWLVEPECYRARYFRSNTQNQPGSFELTNPSRPDASPKTGRDGRKVCASRSSS